MTSGEGSELNYGTKNVLSCWNSSLGKLDEQTRKEYLEKLNKHLESGKPITLRFEKHFLGMPTRGFIGDPFYIMEIIDDI